MSQATIQAVLALDAYNRGFSPSMGVSGNKIGSYTLLDVQPSQTSTNISFSATTYLSTDGSTIISYRGTDDWDWNTSGDPLNGFPIGAGIPFGSQFFAAFEFYKSVVDDLIVRAAVTGSNIDPSAISLTGHSLGGGLAGLVAAFHGKDAEIFANMPFEEAADEAYQYMIRSDIPVDPGPDPQNPAPYSDPVLHDLAGDARALIYGGAQPWQPMIGDNLHGYAVKSEPVAGLRALTFQSTPVTDLDPGTANVTSLTLGERHSMALHTLLLWEKENGTDVKWKEVSDHLWDAYSKDAIGTVVGYPQNTRSFESTPGEQLATAIAYSVIDEGARPFGDTAVKALFSDANDLGYAAHQDSSSFLRDDAVQGDIANLAAHYAGLLARAHLCRSY